MSEQKVLNFMGWRLALALVGTLSPLELKARGVRGGQVWWWSWWSRRLSRRRPGAPKVRPFHVLRGLGSRSASAFLVPRPFELCAPRHF